MLVAMTYSTELFIVVCCGLTAGYVFFIMKFGEPANTDPCCFVENDKLLDSVAEVTFESSLLQHGSDVVNSVIEIEGMTCSACVKVIEKTLNSLQGVLKASVNLSRARGYVSFESDHISIQKIVSSIEAVGYGARVIDGV
jgi:copper chaperone CopZ